ncbi:YtxH domain-containing protein [Dyadobacter psychrophilus]|uniref:YtxH-like protein n=1 Tax=Dyadobacter psychrophilus TaxID=651661 RepID=A0A1T5B7T2_9BACT|nr:YtxH domain-containing protein [Dyadobacter psychrophilus]SKB43344.1 YtxH-like protein [Dyadobacter psychrophilus]
MKKTSVLLSVLVAAGAGIIVGILIAPNSGARTRRKIQYLGQDALEELEQTIEDSFDDLKRQTQKKCTELRNKLMCNPQQHFNHGESKDQPTQSKQPGIMR